MKNVALKGDLNNRYVSLSIYIGYKQHTEQPYFETLCL
jgi:hypothetical protein